MQPASPGAVASKRLWAGRVLSALAVMFLMFDSVIKLLKLPPAVEGTVQLGYPEHVIVGIGLVELVCLALYVIPSTSVLGAILFTGYLGGAIATHVRIGSPLFTHTLFPIYVAALIWGGLFLREKRLNTLIPLRRQRSSEPLLADK
jgi:hypothetical protein